jgi:hypothetical protein
MNEKSHVALVKRVCRVCLQTEDAEILLATHYHKNGEPVEDLAPMHGKVVGFIEDGMCKKCKEKHEGFLVLIGCDLSANDSSKDNPVLLGKNVLVKKDSGFGLYLQEKGLIKDDIAYIDKPDFEELQLKISSEQN